MEGSSERVSQDDNADFMSILPYERKLATHKGSDSVEERAKIIFVGSLVERSKVIGPRLIGALQDLHT